MTVPPLKSFILCVIQLKILTLYSYQFRGEQTTLSYYHPALLSNQTQETQTIKIFIMSL